MAATNATAAGPLNRLVGLFADAKATIKAAYQAALQTRFRRRRDRLGGTADAHLANETEYWTIREYARDFDRNDGIVGQAVDRAVDNCIGSGFKPIPNTGDPGLDAECAARFEEWALDPKAVDVAGKMTFRGMQRQSFRSTLVDGDCFLIPTGGGALQFLEGDAITSPSNQSDSVVHGVELDDLNRAVNYWISKGEPNRRKQNYHRIPGGRSGYDIRPGYNAEGNPNIFHIYRPKRPSQSRGVTAFAPVFDLIGMFEDTNFAKLTQQQIVSCIALFLERESDYQLGARSTQTEDDSTTSTIEGLSPGLIIRGKAGEKPHILSPTLQPQEWEQHAKLILRIIGVNLGLPLCLVLLDTRDTTFHGYRGELKQAEIGFTSVQAWLEELLHRPTYAWKMREWYPNKPQAQRHRWSKPGFPYVDPLADAKADAFALENLLISPRDLAASRGRDWPEIVRETVEDRALAIRTGAAAAAAINKELKLEGSGALTWRDLLNLKTPTGVTITEKKLDDSGGADDQAEPARKAA